MTIARLLASLTELRLLASLGVCAHLKNPTIYH